MWPSLPASRVVVTGQFGQVLSSARSDERPTGAIAVAFEKDRIRLPMQYAGDKSGWMLLATSHYDTLFDELVSSKHLEDGSTIRAEIDQHRSSRVYPPNDLSAGMSIEDAVERRKKHFPALYGRILKAVVETGRLRL